MTLVFQRSDIGEDIRVPLSLDNKRRRLSTIARRHRIPGRPYIVSVHKANGLIAPTDESVVLRKNWSKTLVGKNDVVLITYLPLGGMGGGGGGKKGGKNIGMALAMLVLAIAVPYMVGAVSSAVGMGGVLGTTSGLTMAGKIVAMGIIAGVGYLMQRAAKEKKKPEDNRPVYGVSGGGNLPRKGDRIPVNYGRCWYQPDLSQADYFTYVTTPDNDTDQILYKRMTLGGGEYQIHTIKVGDAIAWDDVNGAHAPFTNMELEFITPGQPSKLVPGAVWSSDMVGGIDLGHTNDPQPWHGPYPVCEPGSKTSRIQLDYSWPNGIYQTHPKKTGKLPMSWGIVFEYQAIDDDGNAIGPFMTLFQETGFSLNSRAVRRTTVVDVPEGRYAVRAKNAVQKLYDYLDQAGVQVADALYWDGLRAHLFNEPLRPEVQEVAMKISAKAIGSTMAFSDVWIETTKKLPVYRGGAWVLEATRKAVWAFYDIITNPVYGGALDPSKVDINTLVHYDQTIPYGYDEFNGQIRGPVSVYEAAVTALGVVRAEPVLFGDVWSMTRDEPRQFVKHVVSRRQIVKDTSGIEYDLDLSNGESDVIVEYYVNGDPKRRAEVRETIGERTITPRRIDGFGITGHEHASHLARWYAACAYYRRENRVFTTEMTGRIFARNDPALVEMWFLDTTQAAGVVSRTAYDLTFDCEISVPDGSYLVLRDEKGQEWGPVAIQTLTGPRSLRLSAADVDTVTGYTGKSLDYLFAKTRRRMPMTAMIGSLSEINRPYIIRASRPDGMSRVQVEALYDAPEVWSILGESVPPGPPVTGFVDQSVQIPILPWVSAKIVQKSTAIYLDWAVGAAQACDRYQVWMRYYGRDNWELVSDGAAMDGSYPADFSKTVDTPRVDVRARTFNRLGVPSQYKYMTAALFAPIINNDLAWLEVKIEDMAKELQYQLSLIAGIGQGSLAKMRQDLDTDIQRIADAAATESATTYDKIDLIKVALEGKNDEAFAAIEHEQELRISADEALARDQLVVIARLDNFNNSGLTAESVVENEKQARIDQDGVLASDIDSLRARLTDAEGNISAEADAYDALEVRVTQTENGLSAQASSISVLNSTVNNHSATLTTYGQSIDGIKVQWGVIGTIDGVTGGFLLQGIRKLDGSVAYTVQIHGDFFVDGSITGRAINGTSLIISGSAQIGSLVVGNQHLQANSATNGFAVALSAGNYSMSGGIWVQPNSFVVVIVTIPGGQGIQNGYNLYANGSLIRQDSMPSVTVDVNGFPAQVGLGLTSQTIHYPTGGSWTYQLDLTGSVNTAWMTVLEFSK